MSKIDSDGTRKWYDKNNKLHRDDGPAVEYANGSKEWFQHGHLHREDGPAVEWCNGTKIWFQWYQHGKRHREDGPAIEYTDGTKDYFIRGLRVDKRTYLKKFPVQNTSKNHANDAVLATNTTNQPIEVLLEKLTAAVSFVYRQDQTSPGVLVSKLNNDFYGSILRYEGPFGNSKKVVCSVRAQTLPSTVQELAKKFLTTINFNPINELSNLMEKS